MLLKETRWADPVAIFSQLKDSPFSIFLDSSLNNSLGRYSLIAFSPFGILECKNHVVKFNQNGKVDFPKSGFFKTLSGLLNLYKIHPPKKTLPFHGGAIGYFGYELLHLLEKIPSSVRDDLKLPEAVWGFYDSAMIFDHKKRKIYLVSTGLPERNRNKAKKSIELLEEKLTTLKNKPSVSREYHRPKALHSNFTKEKYLQSVLKAKHLIKEGEIYQVNLSQRFETEFEADPWELYQELRNLSPSPFGGYINFGPFQLLCSSPERFLRVQGNLVETRPMKGTRPRGKNLTRDLKLKNELLGSEKDSAELLMITDLLRNDLGKVCEYRTVKVKKLKNLERYKSVFQTTALIEGKLHKAKDRLDLIRACFPGGSITGAPKVRATQIIAELEPTARGPYTGALGYLDFSGNMELNIIIRSVLIKNKRAYFQVGGGIVADSDPEKEYLETLTKARAMIEALNHG